MDVGQPRAPGGVATCDFADMPEHDAHEPEPKASPAVVAPALVAPDRDGKVAWKVADSHDEGTDTRWRCPVYRHLTFASE